MTGLGLTAWIYLLDKKIKEQVDSNILQGTRKEIPGGRIYQLGDDSHLYRW